MKGRGLRRESVVVGWETQVMIDDGAQITTMRTANTHNMEANLYPQALDKNESIT